MSSHRPYRPAFGVERALSEVMAERGTRYDPDAVDACVYLIKKKGFEVTPADAPRTSR
jgi:HD-GYP domain-containing protein (c-di-GMP phosphodiesterase class II)